MNASERESNLDAIKAAEFDVLIIGAGINGVSTFRELALNGVSVLLVDKQDFCAGTSAAPSRLIHGGIKYLENGEFRLVAESTHERNRLLHNAPHLVKPLPCTVPFYSWFGGLFNSAFKFFRLPVKGFKKRGRLVVKIGMSIYDWMGRKRRVMPTHEIRGAKQSLQMFPGLDPSVISTATYYDALITQPERLCLELITDTLRDTDNLNHHCAALNYASVVAGNGADVTVADEVSGEQFTIRPKLVVNAGGPWIDPVNKLLGIDSHYIGGSKGSHLILDHPQMLSSLNGHMMYFETGDNRLCLAYPIGDRVLVGTTDIRVDDPDTVKCEDEEIDYLIDAMTELLPGIPFTREHIVYSYTGVRPLPFDDGVGVGSVSRDHSIEVDESTADRPFDVASLVGGKWTTFRAFGEVAADLVMEKLQQNRTTDTYQLGIGGGRDFPLGDITDDVCQSVADQYQLPTTVVGGMMARYGRNDGVFNALAAEDGLTPLEALSTFLRGEIRYICENEFVVHLDDLIFRRSTLALEGRATEALVAEVAAIAAPLLNWSEARTADEIERCNHRLRTNARGVA
jgi:glycerol-3-phosphate dehydrogenase